MLLVFDNGFLWIGQAGQLRAWLTQAPVSPKLTLGETLQYLRQDSFH